MIKKFIPHAVCQVCTSPISPSVYPKGESELILYSFISLHISNFPFHFVVWRILIFDGILQVRYVMRCIFGDPRKAPPPIEKLSPEAIVSSLWKGEGSFVEELLQCISAHVEEDILNDLKSKIHAHDPSGSEDIQKELRKSLLW